MWTTATRVRFQGPERGGWGRGEEALDIEREGVGNQDGWRLA